MSELNGLENRDLPRDSAPPDWETLWGTEAMDPHYNILDQLWMDTRGMTAEQQNEHFRAMKREVIPLIDRCNAVWGEESREAFAVWDKYHTPGTGVRHTLLKEYEALMQDLKTRLPQLHCSVKFAKPGPVIDTYPAICFGDMRGPFILFNNKIDVTNSELQVKAYKALREVSLKREALMKEQNHALTRALRENGIQLPHECATIRRQLEDLKSQSLDKIVPKTTENDVASDLQSGATGTQLESEGLKTGESQEILPGANLKSYSEDHSNSTFAISWDNQRKPWVPPAPKKPPPREMTGEQLQEFLKSLHRFKCGKFFETPLTEQESPEYFALVKEPRDLVKIKDNLSQNPEYRAREFFNDMRIMIDNYSHVFGEGSEEHNMAGLIEQAMLKKLEGYGEAGVTAKAHFDRAPRAEFNDPIPVPEADGNVPSSEGEAAIQPEVDEAVPPSEGEAAIPPSEADNQMEYSVGEDDFETSFAQGINNNYEDDYGEEHDATFDVRDEVFDDQDDGAYDNDYEYGPGSQYHGTPGPAQQLGSQDGHVTQAPATQGQNAGERDLVGLSFEMFDMAKQYDQAHGHADRAPGGKPTAQWREGEGSTGNQYEDGHNSPYPDFDKPAEQSDEEYSIPNPAEGDFNSPYTGVPGPVEQPGDEDSDILSPIASPSPSLAAQPEPTAGESEDEGAHAGAHISKQPAPIAPMYAEQPAIDPFSSPQRQTSDTKSASTKRARASDDQDSFSSEETLSSKRQKTAADSSLYAATFSLGKRSRDDGDEYVDEEREPPPKRSRASSPSVPEPLPAATSAAQANEPSLAPNDNLLGMIRNAQLSPSPLPEPLTPVAAAVDAPAAASPLHISDEQEVLEEPNHGSDANGDESRQSSSPSASPSEPQTEPATEALGHTNNGAINASKLHKLPKYKKKGGSKGRGRPNRPWVFGYRFGDEYGLYIMGCPKKGCEMGSEVFKTHPLAQNNAANHLEECGHDFDGDDDMVRKFGTQVISDAKKAVSVEWARNWNKELMKEYGDEDREAENF